MDPHSLERRWVDEVRYLHSLWRQGPPQNPNPNLRPLTLTSFKNTNPTEKKRKKKKKEKERENQTKKNKKKKEAPSTRSDPSGSNSKWPSEPPPAPQPQTGWGERQPPAADPSARPATAEERAKLAAFQLQRSVLNSCRDFFSKKNSSDGEEDEEEEDDSIDDGEGESESFKFFLGLFSDDEDLRSYYEKNFEGGDFLCLACGGIGEKVGKRFGNCVALVQHSNYIIKTKGRNAHRAFGKAVCRVLGWNTDRLPSIVLDLGEPLGRSLEKKAEPQVNLAFIHPLCLFFAV